MQIIDCTVHGIPYLACNGISVPHGFSTRLGGVSSGIWQSMNLGTTRGDKPDQVRENYRLFCAAIGADSTRIAMSNQIHGNTVRIVTAADQKQDLYDPEGYEVDGLVTDVTGLTLVVFGADCPSILFHDPVRRVIAAVHAGWRGTAAGIAAQAVETMIHCYGSNPCDIIAAIGPGISRCCFETHREVPESILSSVGELARPYLIELGDGTFKVDLKGVNTLILQQAGLSQIAVTEDCTKCLPEKYWSHRATQGQRGSMAALIMLEEHTP